MSSTLYISQDQARLPDSSNIMGRFSGTIIISDDEGDDEKVQFLGRSK
jgi:hypothetical protein